MTPGDADALSTHDEEATFDPGAWRKTASRSELAEARRLYGAEDADTARDATFSARYGALRPRSLHKASPSPLDKGKRKKRLFTFATAGSTVLVLLVAAAALTPPPPKVATLHPARAIPAVDPNTPDGHKIDVREGVAFLRQVSDVADPCDLSFRYTNAALSAVDMQNLYHNAEVGSSRCQGAADRIRDIPVPEHATDEVQAEMKNALGNIWEVLASERDLMDRLKGFANNGGARPSDIGSYQNDFSRAQAEKNVAVENITKTLKNENALPSGLFNNRHHHKTSS